MNIADERDNQYLIPYLPEGFDPEDVESYSVTFKNGKLKRFAFGRCLLVEKNGGIVILIDGAHERISEHYWAKLISERNEVLIHGPAWDPTENLDDLFQAMETAHDNQSFVSAFKESLLNIRSQINKNHQLILFSFPEEFKLSDNTMFPDEDHDHRQTMNYRDTFVNSQRLHHGWFFRKETALATNMTVETILRALHLIASTSPATI